MPVQIVNGHVVYTAPTTTGSFKMINGKLTYVPNSTNTTTTNSTNQTTINTVKNVAASASTKTNTLTSNLVKRHSAANTGLNIDDYNNFGWLDKSQPSQSQTSSQYYSSPQTEQQQTQKTVTTYDLSGNFKDVQTQAKQYGVSVAIPKTTQYKSQSDAQKALDAYVASVNKALEVKFNKDTAESKTRNAVTYAAPTRGYYDGLTPTQRNEVDNWNLNNRNQGINDAINPDWVVWRNYKLPGAEPPKFWKDVTSNSPSARDAYQARMDAEHAESQRQLAEAYAATPKAAGTTHAKSTKAVTNNGKSASQIYNEQKSVKPTASKLQIVSPDKVAPSVTAKQLSTVKSELKSIVKDDSTIQDQMKKNAQVKQSSSKLSIIQADHPNQVQLKNGKWVDRLQKVGAANPNSGTYGKVYMSSDAEKQKNAADYKAKLSGTYKIPTRRQDITNGKTKTVIQGSKSSNAGYDKAVADEQAAAAQYKVLRDNFKEVIAANGALIDAVQSGGHKGTGESNIRIVTAGKNGKVTSTSGTAGEYKINLDIAKRNAAIPITSETSVADKKAIMEARNYLVARSGNTLKTEMAFLGVDGASAPRGKIKTVDELRQEKLIARGGLGALSVKLDQKFRGALQYDKVTGDVNNAINAKNKKITPYIPTTDQVVNARTRLWGIENTKKLDKIIEDNKYLDGFSHWYVGKYEGARNAPVNAAGVVAAWYAGGAVAGAAFEGAITGVEAGAAKVALSSASKSSKILRGASTAVANGVRPVTNTAMIGSVGYSGVNTLIQGDIANDLDFFGSLAVGGLGYSKGARAFHEPVSIIPGLRSVDVKEGTTGASGNTKNIHVGTTLSVNGKPVLSRDYKGIHRGGAEINPDALRSFEIKNNKVTTHKNILDSNGKVIKTIDETHVEKTSGMTTKPVQAYSVLGEKSLDKHVTDVMSDDDKIYYLYGKQIARDAYNAKKPVTNPKSFDLLSTHVSDEMKPVLKTTIAQYGGGLGARVTNAARKLRGRADYKIQVVGSGSQKLQMGEYLTRMPGDLEVYVDSPTTFVNRFVENATKKGFVENQHFEIQNKGSTTPKIYFKIEGNMEKGVEIFKRDSKKVEHNVIKEFKDEYDHGWQEQKGIAYNFKELSSISVDHVKLQKLQEQAARKYAGSSYVKGNIVEPIHPGRIKDSRDLIEIGVANKLTHNLGNESEIVAYTKSVANKYPEVANKKIDDRIVKETENDGNKARSHVYSPIADFIVHNGRLPSKAEVMRISSEFKPKEIGEKELLYSNDAKSLGKALNDVLRDSNHVTRSAGSMFSNASSIRSGLNGSSLRSGRAGSNASKASSGSSKGKSVTSTRSTGSPRNSTGSGSSKKASSSPSHRPKSSTPSKRGETGHSSKGDNTHGSSKGNKYTGSVRSKTSSGSKPSINSKNSVGSVNSTSSISSKNSVSSKLGSNYIGSGRSSNSGSSGSNNPNIRTNSSNSSSMVIFKRRKPNQYESAKKPKKTQTYIKRVKDIEKMKRTIFNKLGGLESMLGGSSKPTKKRSTARKTTKRAGRA